MALTRRRHPRMPGLRWSGTRTRCSAARLSSTPQAWTPPPARPVRGRPWKADGAHRPFWRCTPTVLTAPTPVRHASVDTATCRSTARQG